MKNSRRLILFISVFLFLIILPLCSCSEKHTHAYDQKNTDNKYLAVEANCTEKAKYYYSCSCGEIGTSTFESGEALGHDYTASYTWSADYSICAITLTCSHDNTHKITDFMTITSEVTSEATTEADGEKTFTAIYTYNGSKYTDSKTESIAKLGHTHAYDQKNTDSKYLISAATCTSPAIYNISCSCGEIGTSTFESGEALGHDYTASYTWSADYSICAITLTCSHDNTHKITDFMTITSEVTSEATTEADGEKTFTATYTYNGSNYTDSKTESIAKLDHIHTFENDICTACDYSKYLIFELDYDGISYIVTGCDTSVSEVYIPSTYNNLSVKRIANSAFNNCSTLRSVTIPASITSIGKSAFVNCSKFTNVYYNGTIEDWCNIAFSSEDSNPMYYADYFYLLNSNNTTYEEVTEIEIPDTIITIDNYQFYGFNDVTSITIPSSVTSIGTCTIGDYNKASAITNIYYNGTIESWCKINLSSSPMEYAVHFYLLNNVTNNYDEVIKIEIPNTITTIGDSQFYGFSNVTSITIPEGVTSIGDYAFYECTSLTSITIPSSVTRIGNYAFDCCYKLVEVYNLSNNLTITIGDYDNGDVGYYALDVYTSTNSTSKLHTTDDGYIFYENDDTVYLIEYTGSSTTLTLPDKYNDKNYSIYQYAFYGCTSLTSITIPSSVTSIGNDAFSNCTSLTSITIPSSVTSIGDSAFAGCTSLTSITIEEGVTSIGSYAFQECTSLATATIPSTVTSIGQYAFYKCFSLIYVKFSSNTNNVSLDAFSWCGKLIEVYTLDENKITAGSYDFGYLADNALNVYTDTSGSSKLTITDDGYIFYVDIDDDETTDDIIYLLGYTGSSTTLTLPDKYNDKNYNIYRNAFAYNTNITSITIPEGVTSIGDGAFYNCTSLTSITIPSSVTSIGQSAFYNCTSLTSVTIPDGVTSIGQSAFYNCTSLTSITIPSGVISIESEVFKNCTSLISITIPSSVTSIENFAFNNCKSLIIIYYTGSFTDWYDISIYYSDSNITSSIRYYYSSTNPFNDTLTSGNYWHYDTEGNIAIWSNTTS